MPSFASTSGPARKVDVPIKNKRYQIPRYPFQGPMEEGMEPVAGTGMLVPWTRVSTLLDTHKDKEGIFKWVKRLVIKGIGARPDLYALAAATRLDDRATLDRIGDQAFDLAGGQAASNIGSALHSFLERWLEGDKTLVIPDQWRPDVAAVTAAFQDAGIRPVPELQEMVIVRPDLRDGDSAGLAGRLDLVVEYEGQLTIADYKTGSDPLLYGAWEIQQQGGIYGSAWAIWDGEFFRPMPAVRRDKMLMVHVLPGQSTVTISEIDLDPAELEEDIASAYRTRRRRKEAKKAHRLVLQVQDGAVDAPMQGGTVAEVLAATPGGPAGPFKPTPDAALAQHKAAERLAVVDKMAKAQGRNDDPDDGEPAAEPVSVLRGVNGEGKTLQPYATPGKKGCSVCHRIGHRKGSKACLGEGDAPSGSAPAVAPHTHGVNGWTRNPLDGLWYCGTEGCKRPAAVALQGELTAEQETGEGTFPGQVTPEELAAAQAFDTDQNKVDNGEAAQVHDSVMLPGADGPEEPDPFDDDGSQVLSAKEQDWHLFLDRISEAKDKAEIRAIRAEATDLGVWDEDLLKAGLERIKTF